MHLVIVTGGSRGLGKALVDLYQSAEWNTLELSRNGTGLQHISVDLSDLDASFPVLQAQFQTLAKTKWDRVVFLNNAGTLTSVIHPEWLTIDDYKSEAAVNIYGLIDVTMTFLPLVKMARGRVVNTSSMAGRFSMPHITPYTVSKYGVEPFTDGLRSVVM